jgi:hypothetical protein
LERFLSPLDTQNHLHRLSLVYTSEQSSLLPRAYFHEALEQVAGDDEVLDFILEHSPSWIEDLEVRENTPKTDSRLDTA